MLGGGKVLPKRCILQQEETQHEGLPAGAAHHGKVPGGHTVHAGRPLPVEDRALRPDDRLHEDGVQDAHEQRGRQQRPQRVVHVLLRVPAMQRMSAGALQGGAGRLTWHACMQAQGIASAQL